MPNLNQEILGVDRFASAQALCESELRFLLLMQPS